MPAPMTDAQRAMLALLANALFDRPLPELPDDPGQLVREANLQGVFLLAMKNTRLDSYPADLREEIRVSIKKYLSDNLRLDRAHASLSGLLETAGIPHTLIKGYACALWYPDPELRQTGDIDFYVDPQDLERAEALLAAEGFTPEKLSHKIHHVYIKDGCRYELHFGIPGVPEGAAGDRCRAYFEDMTDRSVLRQTPFGPMRVPAPFHHGLILLLHTAHHLTHSGVGLRHLCDWAVFRAKMPEEVWRKTFEEPLRTLGLWRFARCLTDLSARYLGCPASPAEPVDAAIADGLLADALDGGNLGQKNVVRSREAYLITAGKRSQSTPRRFFAVMTDMINQKWPVTKKIKLLVPVGWGFYGARYLCRAAAGKRPKLYAREALRGAQERTALYNQFRLFEEERENA